MPEGLVVHKSQVTKVPGTKSLKFLYACILNTVSAFRGLRYKDIFGADYVLV